MKEQRIWLTAEQAKSLLSKSKFIHTFRSDPGVLVGADWRRAELIKLIDKLPAEHIEIGGEMCKNMGHGLVIYSGGPLFVEVDKAKLQSLENALTVKV